MSKRTPLYDQHVELSAKIIDFAGFEMPLQYTGVIDEHICVREKAGLFDVSHMGEIWVKGKHALELIQYITTNDASVLKEGEAQYSCFPNGKGGIIDDIIVYRYSDDKYFIVVNASNTEKDWNWINSNNKFGAILENSSDRIAQIALQGPLALQTIQKLTNYKLETIKSFGFAVASVAGIENVIISNTGYTGAGGFELYANNENAEKLWKTLLDAGKEYKIQPCGLAARDTLRLEKGYCLYGNEIDDSTSPIEAGLGWIVKNKTSDFINKDEILSQKRNGVSKKLVGFELIEMGIPRHNYEIADDKGKIIGHVTSGTMSPSLKKPIGIGYVETKYAEKGSLINIVIRNKNIKAKVISLPFL